ncbi:protein fantom-like [Monodelphis domestica]|uniref:protein fantom-like n=1 Tax=Monodelphis domestica TaxID=13616 RepID=UPI0024E1D50A|nr:protein fantom-like [Monodelphis domestica]
MHCNSQSELPLEKLIMFIANLRQCGNYMRSLPLVDDKARDMPIRKPSMVTSTQGRNIKSQLYLSKMSRKELEDNFSRLQEESLLMKELSWKQEDQIKRMKTKLLRLTADRRTSGEANRSSRNLKTEETIENLKDQVWQLQRHNEGLNNRLLMYKQQLQVQSSGRSPYSYVQPRIKTGRRKLHTSDAQILAKLKRGERRLNPNGSVSVLLKYSQNKRIH